MVLDEIWGFYNKSLYWLFMIQCIFTVRGGHFCHLLLVYEFERNNLIFLFERFRV